MTDIRLLVLAAIGLFSLTPRNAVAQCRSPRVDSRGWVSAHSPRLPTIRFRLPPVYSRDPGEDTFIGQPTPRGSRWAAPRGGQIVIQLADSGAPNALPVPDSAVRYPEFSRCTELVGTANGTIVSFNRLEEVGDMAYIGPYQGFATFVTPGGTVVRAFYSAPTRKDAAALLAAFRTVRIDDPN